jgi:hypothetical protein
MECVDQFPTEVMARRRGDEAGGGGGTGSRSGAMRDATILIRVVGDRLCPYNPCRGMDCALITRVGRQDVQGRTTILLPIGCP